MFPCGRYPATVCSYAEAITGGFWWATRRHVAYAQLMKESVAKGVPNLRPVPPEWGKRRGALKPVREEGFGRPPPGLGGRQGRCSDGNTRRTGERIRQSDHFQPCCRDSFGQIVRTIGMQTNPTG